MNPTSFEQWLEVADAAGILNRGRLAPRASRGRYDVTVDKAGIIHRRKSSGVRVAAPSSPPGRRTASRSTPKPPASVTVSRVGNSAIVTVRRAGVTSIVTLRSDGSASMKASGRGLRFDAETFRLARAEVARQASLATQRDRARRLLAADDARMIARARQRLAELNAQRDRAAVFNQHGVDG